MKQLKCCLTEKSPLLRVAARRSPLSQAQCEEVEREVFPLRFEKVWVDTQGDFDQITSLQQRQKDDFFTHEIDHLLLGEQVRIAIHSAKDLPVPLPTGLEVVALTRGQDPRDCVVLQEGVSFESLPLQAVIGTSSLRRQHALLSLRKDLRCKDVRGWIHERLELVWKKKIDGLVIAEAALVRLGLTHLNRAFLPGVHAEGQGQLAIVARRGDLSMKKLFAPLDIRQFKGQIAKMLYIGLRPPPSCSNRIVLHYPVIRTTGIVSGALQLGKQWSLATHLLLTSQSALDYIPSHLNWKGKTVIAIGEATAIAARKRGVEVIPALESTQEGVIALLRKMSLYQGHLLWPHSLRARSILSKWLLEQNISHECIALYETQLQKPGFAPHLEAIDQLFFTSPSCVESFIQIYPRASLVEKTVFAQGPITADACRKLLGVDSIVMPK